MHARSVEELFANSPETGTSPLTTAQRRAVESSLHPQIVLAGPGTGKTRVLVYRAAYLLLSDKHRFDPADIVVVTFTTKAAAQLTSRLHRLIGPDAQFVRAGTIHHFCYRLLKAYPEAARVPENFTVADQVITKNFWSEWCDQNGYKNHRQVMTRIGRFWLGEENLSRDLRRADDQYRETLHSRGYLDFDDLLTFARALLRDHADVCDEVRSNVGALLVDEFQDTDAVQYDVLSRVVKPDQGGLFCVADDDQSIYSFRGARPRNVEAYIHDYGCCEEAGTRHVLDKNYRSHESIFRLAETVLDPKDRLKERGTVRADKEGGDPPMLFACPSEADEAAFARDLVTEWIGEGVAHKDIAVLTPWNATNASLEQHFLKAGIPCDVSGSRRLLETEAGRALHALLRLLHRHQEGLEGERELEAYLRTVLAPQTFGAVQDLAGRFGDTDEPLRQAFNAIVLRPNMAGKARLQSGEIEEVRHAFSLLLNTVQRASRPDATIEDLVAEVLPQLRGSLQLLAQAEGRLRDPLEDPSIRAASNVLRFWLSSGDRNRTLVIHHEQRSIERLWTVFARTALEPICGEGALSIRGFSDGANPREGDLVITGNAETLAARMAAHGRGVPAVIGISVEGRTPDLFAHEPSGDGIPERLPRQEVSPVSYAGVEGTYESSSVALFKTFQAALAPPVMPYRQAYVMVDLETTSADPRHCRVAEIGALRVVDGAAVEDFERLIALPDDVTAEEEEVLQTVCGFDLAGFNDAPSEEDAFAALCDFAAGLPLVAHNGQGFDFVVLNRLHKRHAAGEEPAWSGMYDMLPLARELCPDLRSHSAESLLRDLLGEQNAETAHRAVADCRAQQRILRRLQEVRARRGRVCHLEALLPAIAAAMAAEPSTHARDSESDEALLLRAGYQLALRGGHEILGTISSLPGQAGAAKAIRSRFDAVVSEVAYRLSEDTVLSLDDRLRALVAPYADQTPTEGLEDLLMHLALWGEEAAEQREEGRKSDLVAVSTYHSAKGLEFERVICTGLHSGAFPAFYCDTDECVRENRRLLYVGMTRAESRLVLTYAEEDKFARRNPCSPFLKEGRSQGLIAETPAAQPATTEADVDEKSAAPSRGARGARSWSISADARKR